jgi:hypothetical protein
MGGTPDGVGGTAAGTGGSLAGMGGIAGMGGAPAMPCPDGCAELSVPFTAYKATQYFEIYLASDTDLTAATITVKARKVAGKAGGLLIAAKNGSAQAYAYAQGDWNAISDMTADFASYTLDLANPGMKSSDMFDPTAVQIVSVVISAGDPWYTDTSMTTVDLSALVNPTVVQVDEIAIAGSGTYPGPYAFTSDATPLVANLSSDGLAADPPYAVSGSMVTWVGP